MWVIDRITPLEDQETSRQELVSLFNKMLDTINTDDNEWVHESYRSFWSYRNIRDVEYYFLKDHYASEKVDTSLVHMRKLFTQICQFEDLFCALQGTSSPEREGGAIFDGESEQTFKYLKACHANITAKKSCPVFEGKVPGALKLFPLSSPPKRGKSYKSCI